MVSDFVRGVLRKPVDFTRPVGLVQGVVMDRFMPSLAFRPGLFNRSSFVLLLGSYFSSRNATCFHGDEFLMHPLSIFSFVREISAVALLRRLRRVALELLLRLETFGWLILGWLCLLTALPFAKESLGDSLYCRLILVMPFSSSSFFSSKAFILASFSSTEPSQS